MRKKWQQAKFDSTHEQIRNVLIKSLDTQGLPQGMTRSQLAKKTGFVRKTIRKHLHKFRADGEIRFEGKKIFHNTVYELWESLIKAFPKLREIMFRNPGSLKTTVEIKETGSTFVLLGNFTKDEEKRLTEIKLLRQQVELQRKIIEKLSMENKALNKENELLKEKLKSLSS